jgi:hypothetical protein
MAPRRPCGECGASASPAARWAGRLGRTWSWSRWS